MFPIVGLLTKSSRHGIQMDICIAVSGCNLKSDMGTMEGKYQMLRELDGCIFEVNIPKFDLIAPHRLN